MHKVVNGKKVELSEEEIKEVEADWAANEEYKKKKTAERERIKALKENAKLKILKSCQLEQEEIDVLFK